MELNKITRLVYMALVTAAFTMSGCGENNISKQIDILEESVSVENGKSVQLTLIEHLADMPAAWSSSDEAIAHVAAGGIVTGKAVGEVYVYAKVDGAVDSCHVLVTEAIARIGDFFYEDGTFSSEYDSKKKAIGIIFQTDISRIGETEKYALEAKGIDTPHGLVMAVKNAAIQVAWCTLPLPDNIYDLTNCKTVEECNNDISGLFNYNVVKGLDEDFSDFPAFRAVAEYSVKAPENTTGWYLPAVGQLYDFFVNIGGLQPWDKAIVDSEDERIQGHFFWMNQDGFMQNLNDAVASLGYGNYDPFIMDGYQDQYFWSSSEYHNDKARDWIIHDNNLVTCYWNYKSHREVCDVRAILAF